MNKGDGGRNHEMLFADVTYVCSIMLASNYNAMGLTNVQGPAKRLLPGCENAVGKLRQKW